MATSFKSLPLSLGLTYDWTKFIYIYKVNLKQTSLWQNKNVYKISQIKMKWFRWIKIFRLYYTHSHKLLNDINCQLMRSLPSVTFTQPSAPVEPTFISNACSSLRQTRWRAITLKVFVRRLENKRYFSTSLWAR